MGMSVFASSIAVVSGIIGASIVADILDDHELRTGHRQEGMFGAALSFSGKAISGLGIVLGGLIITLISFPVGMAPAEVPEETIMHLGLVVGVLVPLLHLIPIYLIRYYTITREVHADIQAQLEIRRKQTGPSDTNHKAEPHDPTDDEIRSAAS